MAEVAEVCNDEVADVAEVAEMKCEMRNVK
jgi:hypothetical protein